MVGSRAQRWDWRLITLVLIAVAVPTVSPLVMFAAPGIHQLELLVYDWYYRTLPPLKPAPQIVIVGFDDATLERLPQQRGSYPIPRAVQARVVDALRMGGARVLGFDESFTHASPDDALFARALGRHGRVVVAMEPTVKRNSRQAVVESSLPAPLLRPRVVASSNLLVRRLGRVRGLVPFTPGAANHSDWPHFAVAVVDSFLSRAAPASDVSPRARWGALPVVPLDIQGEMLIRYAGPAGTFQPLRYETVYDGAWRDSGALRDKIVLIGPMGTLEDRVDTPRGEMTRLEVMANAVQTLLQHNWIRHWSPLISYAGRLGLCLVLVAAIWKLGMQESLPIAAAEVMLWLIVSQQLLVGEGLWIDTVEPLGALALTYLLASVAEAERMRRLLDRSMPAWVADQMLQGRSDALPRTVEQEVAVIFCDVREYTRLCETLPPATVEDILRQYFTAAEQLARCWGTDIDKFVGDEIMLYYVEKRKRPRPTDESVALRAVRWALTMQAAAGEIDASGVAGAIGFKIGIGIATGVVRIGTVGAQQRVQHTLIGDAVNTASRLQQLTKDMGCAILLSESTYAQLGDKVEVLDMGQVALRGKQLPLTVYCPQSIRNAAGGEAACQPNLGTS